VLRSLVRAEGQRLGRGRAAPAAGAALLADRRLRIARDLALRVAATCSKSFRLGKPTFHLAASLYDSLFLRLAAGEPDGSVGATDLGSPRGSAQAAAVCVCIAAKVEEVVPPTCDSYLVFYANALEPMILEAEREAAALSPGPPPGRAGQQGRLQEGGQQRGSWLLCHFCAMEVRVLDTLGWDATPPTALHFYDRLRALRGSGLARRRGKGAPLPPGEAGPHAHSLLFQAAVWPEVALLFRPSTVALAVLACLRGSQTSRSIGSVAPNLVEACREVERYRAEAHVDPLWLFGQSRGSAATAAPLSEKGMRGAGHAAAPALLGCARARGPCLGGLV